VATIEIKGSDDILVIGLPGLTAVRIDTARRVVAIDGISGTGENPYPEWTVLDLRDGTYGGFHRLTPADMCLDADCSGAGEHEIGEQAAQ
jgi:hypothetical protein